MVPKIVFIDDDRFQIKEYMRPLSAAGFFPVLIKKGADIAKIYKGEAHQDAIVFVVDMMMDCEELYGSEETDSGSLSGLFVSRDLRFRFPTVPIVLWTSAHIDRIKRAAKRHASQVSNCRYADKRDVSPELLTSEMVYYLKTGRFRSRVLRLLWRVAVKVGMRTVGLGADVKELSS